MKGITTGAVLLCAALATAGCAGSSGHGQATPICSESDNASLLQARARRTCDIAPTSG